jgi:surface antigen
VGTAVPTAANADVSLLWEPSASLFWTLNQTVVMTLFQNGQCTQLAADRRPDVVKQIVVGFIGNDIAHGLIEAVPNLDARYWSHDAAAVGIPTGHKPQVGALIVFQPNVLGSGSAGHIAYVTSVRRRRFTISEMNAPMPYQTSSRTLPMSSARLSGVSFVY